MAISPLADTTPKPSDGPNRQQRRNPEQSRTYVGIPEAATYLDVDHKTVRRLISGGELPAYRLGNRVIKVKISDLESVLTPIGDTAEDRINSYIKKVLAGAPPLSDEQRTRLAELLRPARQAVDRQALVAERIAELDGGAA